ncbi:sodium:proline symporter [Sphingobacteriales bacterium UPWRP_1]|nr:sodium:proline symporter [Sphingobacteriales bacterium TSM_CSS]PSJ76536.1 sodium:proline symporter [Sphingobacteriales bacterium UPWRP_1]
MLATLDWVIIAAYLLLSFAIGLAVTKRAGKSLGHFFLGGRNLPWYLAGVSMVATTFAADTPLAVTELVGQSGISGNWLWWNMLAGGMLTTFFFANLWRRSGVLTEVELIELRYSGQPAAFLRGFKAVYLGIFMNAIIIAWVNVALISIFEVFFNLPKSDALLYTALVMLLTAVYSSLSGLLGVALTDAVQFIIAMVGCIILAILVAGSEKIGGIAGLKAQLPAEAFRFFPAVGAQSAGASVLAVSAGAFFAHIGIQWWASWYPGAEPGGGGYVAQRMMSAKNERHAVYATLFFQIAHYCIRPWPWIIVGLCAMVLYPNLPEADVKLGYIYAMRDFLPTGLKGMLVVAFLAAYMSTIATQLNWGASYVVNDLYRRFMAPQATDNQLVAAGRIVTLLLMALGLFVSTQIDSIKNMWSFIIECGAGLGLVLILRWYWWRINAWSEIAATIAPFIAYAASKYVFQLTFPDSFFITVAFTTVVWLIVTFITSPTDEKTLRHFYETVRPDGWWQPIAGKLYAGSDMPKSNLPGLTGAWLSSVLMTYAILFALGKFLFLEYRQGAFWLVAALAGFLLLRYSLQHTRIFR